MSTRKRVTLNEAGVRAYARLASGVARELDRIIEMEGLKRSDVAQKAGLNKAALTRILDGTRNLELRTIAAVLSAVNHVMDVKAINTSPLFRDRRSNEERAALRNNADSQSLPSSAFSGKVMNTDLAKSAVQATATSSYPTSASILPAQTKTKVIGAQQ